MENAIIQKYNFEVSKNKIQTLSRNVPSSVSFQQFPTEGSIFPWNDHNITGSEANKMLVSPLQSTLITHNANIKSLFSIVDEVYKALDSLDREYIQGIINAIKAAEMASNQAKTASFKAETASAQALEASEKALNASSKASIAQVDIKKTIEALRMTVSSLKDFRGGGSRELDSISSLSFQVDSAKKKIQSIELKNGDFSSQIASTKITIQNLEKRINGEFRNFANIQQQSKLIENQKHYGDVDSIWNDVNKHKSVIEGIICSLESFMKRVNNADKDLHDRISNLTLNIKSYSHLNEIDAIWSDVEGHKTNLSGLHAQLDLFVEKMNSATKQIISDVTALQNYRALLETYSHLNDIDTIWSDVEGHKTNLSGLHAQLDSFVEKMNSATKQIISDVTALQNYRALLETYSHLNDIDTIWSDVEGHKTNLLEFHKQVDNFISETNESICAVNKSIDEMKEQSSNRNLFVDKKIKIAYGIAVGSVAISTIQFILQLAGIL